MGEALVDVVASLYVLPPEEFVAARAAAVGRARAAGDREQAAEIARLRKPTVAAWLVNLLVHRRPDLIGDLFVLGDQLRRAQRELRGDRLRELSERRRVVIDGLARQARALAVAAGRGVRDPLPLAAVESTLIAALADDRVAEQVRAGRLTKTVEYAGFGEPPKPHLRLVHGTRIPTQSGPPEAEQRSAGRHRAMEPAGDEHPPRTGGRHRTEEPPSETGETRSAARRRQFLAARAAAHRELAAARTALAAAEAARAAADREVRSARRRLETAQARAAEFGDEAEGRRPDTRGDSSAE